MKRNKNLISISGKIGNGKDTVGKIIQYLEAKNEAVLDLKMPDRDYWINISFEDYFKHNMIAHKYKIVKFANTLKDIVCLLIGCTKEQLEDAEFKNKELGEEWDKLKVRFSDGYDEVENIFPIDFDFSTLLDAKGREAYIYSKEVIHLTPRIILQQVGTQLFREQLHPQIWVNSLFSKYKSVPYRKDLDCGKYDNIYPSWIITDCRFKNELEAVKQRGGITIRVNKPNMFDAAIKSLGIEHISETDLDNQKFDYLINNNGSISDLIDKVKGILIKERII